MRLSKSLLDSLEESLKAKAPKKPYQDWFAYIPGAFIFEIFRLARLGLWAEQEAIPAITHYAKDGSIGSHMSGHGDSSQHISFYNGLKIIPIHVLAKLPDAEERWPELNPPHPQSGPGPQTPD